MSSSQISFKVVLLGSFAVGKTSLTNRFVHQRFSNEYIATLGVKIDKKTVNLDNRAANLIIWDIADITSSNSVPESYFLGTHGVIYVFDLSRSSTIQAMERDLQFLRGKLPEVPLMILGNKKDLFEDEGSLNAVLDKCPIRPDYTSSAKTGENVELVFLNLAKKMLG